MEDNPVKQIRQKTVVDQVMERIKALIASGAYKPADRIPTELELAQMFGIGRSSIREAIKVFQHLGILRTLPAKGTFVCDATNVSIEALTWSILLRKNDMYELLQLREMLEEKGIQELCAGVKRNDPATDAVLAGCALELGTMAKSLNSPDVDVLIDSDYRFHQAIVKGSGNSLYLAIYETLRSFTREEIRSAYLRSSWRKGAVEYHKAILDAIKAGDSEAAAAAYRVHMDVTLQKLRRERGSAVARP